MCLTICDSTMVLESGFDKELIGSDPKKLSVSYLQDLYENTRIPEEQSMCYGCKKIFNNAKDQDKLVQNFPFMKEFSNLEVTENVGA